MLQPRLAAQAAAGHTTHVSRVCGVMLWLVALSKAAVRHLSQVIWIFGDEKKMVTMPDFGRTGASWIISEIVFFLFCFTILFYFMPDTTDNKQTSASVQGACHIQLAITIYSLPSIPTLDPTIFSHTKILYRSKVFFAAKLFVLKHEE